MMRLTHPLAWLANFIFPRNDLRPRLCKLGLHKITYVKTLRFDNTYRGTCVRAKCPETRYKLIPMKERY